MLTNLARAYYAHCDEYVEHQGDEVLGWRLGYWKWSYLGTGELCRGGVVLFL